VKTIEEICTEICENTMVDYLDAEKKFAIAPKLAKLLIDANAVNTTWTFQNPYNSRESIVFLLRYMDPGLIAELLQKGLDLNQNAWGQKEDKGTVAPLTWMIGNAENDTVEQILALAEQYQTPEQRLVWINKTDLMIRRRSFGFESFYTPLSFGLFGVALGETRLEQTALQLSIAKGYQDKSGSGRSISCSNLKLSETLLRLGADRAIDYQEPTLGNTASHIA
jgi:hypothetical protein